MPEDEIEEVAETPEDVLDEEFEDEVDDVENEFENDGPGEGLEDLEVADDDFEDPADFEVEED